MHRTLDRTLMRLAALGVVGVVLLAPFHAFLTVWLSQALGHYTLLRLWKEFVMMLIGFVALYVYMMRPELRRHILKEKLWWLVAGFLMVQIVWGVIALLNRQVTLQALGYGWIVDTRFLIFLLIARVVAAVTPLSKWWPWLVFPSAVLVVMFGLLQYLVLPYDFLGHFGYSAATIFPYEDINHNTQYLRIMSTLRGANPLGAYMLTVLVLMGALAVAWWRSWQRGLRPAAMIAGCAAGLAVLVLTFSRSAWVGLLLSAATLVGICTPRRLRMTALMAASAVLILFAGLGVALQHNAAFQNVFWHTEEDSAIASTSNAGHTSALKNGLADTLHEPLGRGPGTAGPASVYNTGHAGRIAENYFLQIAQETGWVGLGLFVAISIVLAHQLWRRRSDPLALGLLAAFIGLLAVNLLSHAWADDTIAYVWWGLAGIALAAPPRVSIDPTP